MVKKSQELSIPLWLLPMLIIEEMLKISERSMEKNFPTQIN